ncbi:MAG TPA: hypothetical protein VHV28_03865, partial [Solirubrobacteraceae bacterium]|nr:hypothetical protein [Solirubrobacteraceae bacterium]
DGHALAAQDGRHRLGEACVVLDHQHPHPLLLTPSPIRLWCAGAGTPRAGVCPLRMPHGA